MTRPNLDGIDTSRYQEFDGNPLPALTFALHKATEGDGYRDKTMPAFIARYRASRQIRHVGFYHWLRSDSSIDEQAAHFIATVRSVGGLLDGEFAMCDWERTKGIPDPAPFAVERWCWLVGEAFGHHRVAVYSAPWVDGFTAWRQRNPGVAFFLANYRTSQLLPGNGWSVSRKWDATAWQWSGSGRCPGISGDCDLNHVWRPEWFAALNTTTPAPEDDDMGILYKVNDGDTAEFVASGGVARWVRDPQNRAALQGLSGQCRPGPANLTTRAFLADLVLVGPEPQYPADYTGPRTTRADFGG